MTRFYVLVWSEPTARDTAGLSTPNKPSLNQFYAESDAEQCIHHAMMKGNRWRLFVIYRPK